MGIYLIKIVIRTYGCGVYSDERGGGGDIFRGGKWWAGRLGFGDGGGDLRLSLLDTTLNLLMEWPEKPSDAASTLLVEYSDTDSSNPQINKTVTKFGLAFIVLVRINSVWAMIWSYLIAGFIANNNLSMSIKSKDDESLVIS